MIAVGLQEGNSVDDFAVDFYSGLAGGADDSVLVLADIVGGKLSDDSS